MANTQILQRRIKSVKSTKQITKAMELVAASKMRRAHEATLRSRAYRNAAREILARLGELVDITTHPLYARRSVSRKIVIAITSDRGLAGAYNSNVFKTFVSATKQDRANGTEVAVIAIGRQMARFVARLEGVELLAAYENFPDSPTQADVQPIMEMITDAFKDKTCDQVDLLYTDFVSAVTQQAKIEVLLPAIAEPSEVTREDLDDAVFEPSPGAVLNGVTPRLIEAQLFQALLESNASEHSMRMLAMKNASDNASGLIDDLTLAFNSARQAAITQELAEITGGAEAIA